MKVGIITFHWATNYGAVLQTYALQEALRLLGHDVKIINYKPNKFNDSVWTFIRYRKFLRIREYLITHRKEIKLEAFRKQYLSLTERFCSLASLRKNVKDFEVLITGSDQVLNPYFLKHGERKGSRAYFLDFGGNNIRRFAYAASFGVTEYPLNLCDEVRPLIEKFNAVSSRENSGIKIFRHMGVHNTITVCDPTLLHKYEFYDNLIGQKDNTSTLNVSAYFLRGREKSISDILTRINAKYVSDESLTEWINLIRKSSHLVTNSYHGMVFCLIYHIPFTVVLTTKDNIGMNDRFYTILAPLKLSHRIFSEKDFKTTDIEFSDNWDDIEVRLNEIRMIGWDFLNNIKQ